MPVDQYGNYFIATAQQYAPLAAGLPVPNYPGMEGISQLPGMSNPLMQLGMQPLLNRFMGASGMAPMGINGQNVYDTMQQQRFWQQQIALQQHAAQADQAGLIATMRGLASMTGTPWGAEQIRAASSLSAGIASTAPYLLGNDMLDAMAGPRGSAVAMSRYMMSAGRYRMDPLTGLAGMNADSMGGEVDRIFGSMYSGDRVDMGVTRGITAGQFGSLYEQMTLRGMLPGIGGPRDALTAISRDSDVNRGILSRAATGAGFSLPSDISQLSGDQVQKLMGNQDVATAVKGFSGDKVKRTLEQYLDVVNAVKDIFGEMGKPDAPMSELVNAMEAMTNGSMSQLGGSKLNTMIRMTQQLAGINGMGIDAAMQLQQNTSVQAGRLGLDPLAAVDATQGALAFRYAMNNSAVMGTAPVWGRMNADQLTQLDANLRVNAAGSQMANRMGLALRLSDLAGTAGGFAQGSDASLYVQALKDAQLTGADSYTDAAGRAHSLRLSQGEFLGMFGSARLANGSALGLNPDALQGMLGQTAANSQFVEQYGLGDIVRRQQGRADFVQKFGAQNIGSYLGGVLQAHGVSNAAGLASQHAEAIMSQIMNINPGDFGDDATRNAAIAKILQGELGSSMNGIDGTTTASRLVGMLDQRLKFSQFGGLGNMQNAIVAFNQQILSSGAATEIEQRRVADVRTAMAPLNRGSMISHVIGYLQNASDKDPATIVGAVSAMLGGVAKDQISGTLMPAVAAMSTDQAKLEKLQAQIGAIDPTKASPQELQMRRGLASQYNHVLDDLRGDVKRVGGLMTSYGITDDMISQDDTQRALNASGAAGKMAGQMRDGKFSGDPANQKLFGETVRNAGSAAEDVATRAIMSTATANRIGVAGLGNAEAVLTANQKLRELALVYTNGDISALYNDPRTKDQVEGIIKTRDDAVKSIDTALASPATKWDAATQKAIDTKAGDLRGRTTLSGMAAAKQLLELYGVQASDNQLGGLATAMGGQNGMALQQLAVREFKDLATIGRHGAKGGRDVDYVDTLAGDVETLGDDAFKQKYGRDKASVKTELAGQAAMGLGNFGVGGKRTSVDIGGLTQHFNDAVRGGNLAGGSQSVTVSNIPTEFNVKITGMDHAGNMTGVATAQAVNTNHVPTSGGTA